MKYMLLIYNREGCMTEAERAACMADSLRLCGQLKAKGQFIDAAPLQPVATARTVRVRDGRAFVTDGPFTETHEQLGGFYALDLPDLDAAIAVAAQLPPVTKGTVEIRPMLELDGVPPPRPHAPGTTHYLFLVHHAEGNLEKLDPAARQAMKAEAAASCREMAAAGTFVMTASPLHPVNTATSVRVRDGKRLITDGPFAETNEVLAGYYLVRAADRDAALAAAAMQPCARLGSVEVRPLFDLTPVREQIAANP